MEKLTFEDLPGAIELILEKLEKLEKMVGEGQPEAQVVSDTFDISAAALFLGLAKATIYSKVCRGDIPAFKLGKKLLFDRNELEKFKEGNQSKTNFHLKKEADEKLAGRIKKRTYTY